MNLEKRKGQEEIVGFVLIVVIVAVVFVIFLGIRLRNFEPSQKQSEILYQFIESSMEQTTECVLSLNGRNLALDSLIKECYSTDNRCTSGETSCQIAEKTMRNILNNTWKVGVEYPYKGYEIRADYFYNSSNQGQNEEILLIAEGNCNNSFVGNSYWIPEFPGSIIVNAKLCS
ncbi:hypothetical protein J4416_00535 [Candidatus Pacearchaeota archaeon]|nr:hypothetical protein [Candidatus Pacearchaeota archaeon]